MTIQKVESSHPAFVLHPGGKFAYEERETPALESDRDVLIRIMATGLCGSDIHYWQHGRVGPYVVEKPITLGHEPTGIVVACGKNAKGIAVGDRVALEPGIPCGTCKKCRSGRYNLCWSMRFAATPPYDGTLTKYYRVPPESCYKLPPHISFRDGVLVEPLGVAVHCCRLAGDMQNKSVVVFGAGPVGLLCAAVARAFGASTVVAVDIVESRLAVAKQYGPTHTYQMSLESAEVNATSLLEAVGLEEGADIAIDATGAEPCLNCAVHALTRGGTLVQAGLGKPSISFPVGLVCDKEIVFKGCFRYGPGDFDTAIGLLQSRRINIEGLVTHEFPFTSAEKAFQNAANRVGIKNVIYGPDVDENLAKECIELIEDVAS